MSIEQVIVFGQTNENVESQEESNWEKQCRVCLDSEINSHSGMLINPCSCKGSVQWIHQDCLYQQLLYASKNNDQIGANGKKFELNCSICTKAIQVSCKKKYSWELGKHFWNSIKQHRKQIAVILVTLLLSLFGFSIFLKISLNEPIYSSYAFVYIIFIFFSAFLSVVSIALLIIICISASHNFILHTSPSLK